MSTRCRRLLSLLVVATIASASSGCAWIQRVSVDSAGNQADNYSNSPAISADGRYILFDSYSSLVTGDTNNALDVFKRDTAAGTTTRVSVGSAGIQANGSSFNGAISANGRYVVFESVATNLFTGDTNRNVDLFVRDTVAGTTTRVSVAGAGSQANAGSYGPAISANGRYVAFYSYASNLVAGDTNGTNDVFVRDSVAGTTSRVSVDGAGNQANGGSFSPAVSADGRYVGFSSAASNLVAGDTNGTSDVFVRDTVAGTTSRVSVGSSGNQANGGSPIPAVSADGRYVAFDSEASNLVAGDSNGERDVFVRDTVAGTTTMVSDGFEDTDSNGPAISADGRYIAFSSFPTNPDGRTVVFVRDTAAGTTTQVSVDSTGNPGNDDSYLPAISADGRYIAFETEASNLVPGDTNGEQDVIVRANPEPTVSGITPSTLPRGATTPVAIAGSGFIPGALVGIDGTDHSFSNAHVVSPTQITANVTVDSDAALGARNVWVRLPGTGPGFGAGALGVCAACVTVN